MRSLRLQETVIAVSGKEIEIGHVEGPGEGIKKTYDWIKSEVTRWSNNRE